MVCLCVSREQADGCNGCRVLYTHEACGGGRPVTWFGLWLCSWRVARRDWRAIRMTADGRIPHVQLEPYSALCLRLRASAALGRDRRTCMRVCVRPSAAVIAAAAGVGEGSCPCLTAYIDSTILGPYPLPAPSQANLTSIHTATLPTCEHGLIPRALDRPWTRPYETSRAILRHSLVRPVASIATSATRDPTKDCTHGGRPSACPLDYARAAGTGLCIILEGLCQ